jgi:DNA-binding SARP family transcriptional activator/Tfp pilus assembly protein PilF
MEFGLLGPLAVRCGGVDVLVPRGKQRVMLSMLLLNAGHMVPVLVLAEALWGQEPPPSADASIRNYVKRLRKVLGEAGRDRLCTRPPGYLIRAGHDELDVFRFEALLGAARAAAGEGSWENAARQARASLALWRGEPLADVESDALALREVPRLAELRMQAVETWLHAELHLGRHAEIIAELERLTAAHPLREHLYSVWMLALYRDGRQAEALAVYQHARRVLTSELAVEPGAELRELHRRMLAGDTELAAPVPVPAEAEPQQVTPRELPPAVQAFTGRSAELQALTELLDRSSKQAPGAVAISAISGTAGVGKTALALHWAHQVAGQFPDGQLYVNLRGYDPGQPTPCTDALAGFLRSLGVPGQDIPSEADQRAARYRSLLAGKRMLIVLDNAASADQIRPLLPGTSDCTVVVTSRDTLAGLVARDGAERLRLDVLPLEEAVALLRTLIGARVDADPAAADELAGQCCRLPLALRVAAELAATSPAVPLARLAGELADLRTRLDQLSAGGDPRTKVGAVFSWSYRHLDAGAARAFRLAALHPGPEVEPYAAAALTGTTVQQARQALDVLARAHLIQPCGPSRYGMHDLLRAYARELTDSLDTGQEQHAALTRLFDYYLHTASAAMDAVYPAERHRRPRITPLAAPGPPLAGPAAARAWLDGERANLLAVTVHTSEHGWPGHAARLAVTVFRYFDYGGYYPEEAIIQGHGLRAARHTSDADAELATLNALGLAHLKQGRFQQAADYFQQALVRSRDAGNRRHEAFALTNLGIASFLGVSYRKAIGQLQQALALCHETGDPVGEAIVLHNLSLIDWRQRRYQQATRHCRRAVALCRQTGDRDTEAHTLVTLGVVGLRLGRYQQATDHLHRALALSREGGHRDGEAEALTTLGDVASRLGRHHEAIGRHKKALALLRDIGDRNREAGALNSLGESLLAAGRSVDVCTQHAFALGLATQVGNKYEQARAHSGLARACQVGGDSVQARHHWQEALTRYASIGAPEAGEIRAQLAVAGDVGFE